MTTPKEFFLSLDRRSKTGIIVGAIVILLLTMTALWWTLSPKQQLLFGNLRESDAAEIAQSLNEWKIPHEFTDDGAGILVDAKDVHSVRMRLVSAGVPRGGHVGFELFDNNEFGATEFAQRINYQRALQGEMERTIASLPGVTDVRVHLAIKRPGLFLGQREESKASVVLTMAPGALLGTKQIGGIQSLVAAAVEGLSPEAVVVIGPGGAPLSGGATGNGADVLGQSEQRDQLAAEIERRTEELLFNALGNRDAAVSVDVQLNFDRVRKTSERLLAQPGSSVGMLTRRETSGVQPVEGAAAAGAPNERVEYAYGNEREEVTKASGTIERLSIAVVLPHPLPAIEVNRLRRLIVASAGMDVSRGDQLEIAFAPRPAPSPTARASLDTDSEGVLHRQSMSWAGMKPAAWLAMTLLIGLVAGAAMTMFLRRRAPALTSQDSERIVTQIRAWLAKGDAGP